MLGIGLVRGKESAIAAEMMRCEINNTIFNIFDCRNQKNIYQLPKMRSNVSIGIKRHLETFGTLVPKPF